MTRNWVIVKLHLPHLSHGRISPSLCDGTGKRKSDCVKFAILALNTKLAQTVPRALRNIFNSLAIKSKFERKLRFMVGDANLYRPNPSTLVLEAILRSPCADSLYPCLPTFPSSMSTSLSVSLGSTLSLGTANVQAVAGALGHRCRLLVNSLP